MKASNSSRIEQRKIMALATVILCVISFTMVFFHNFSPQDPFTYLIFSFFIVIVTAGSLGALIANKKEQYSNKALTLVCLLIAAVCFTLSFLGFTRKPFVDVTYGFRNEKYIRTERYGAIVLLITGVVYLLIPIVVAMSKKHKNSAFQEKPFEGQIDSKEAEK